MTFSLTGLVRLTVLLGLGSLVVALGVARLEPGTTGFRIVRPVPYVGFSWPSDVFDEGKTRFIDADSGNALRVEFPTGDQIDEPSIAPWEDERGESLMVGRWCRRSAQGDGTMLQAFGLARYRFPSGEPIDQVPLGIIPVGNPCWFPSSTTRILFAAANRQLYRLDFAGEPTRSSDGSEPAEGRAELLTWQCERPGLGELAVQDPVWPTVSQLGRRVFVSVDFLVRRQGALEYGGARIWWLQLDAEGTAVIAAGPVTEPDADPDRPRQDERLPNVTVTPDGQLALAYMTRGRNRPGWTLHVAPLEIDARTGVPRVRTSEVRDLCDRCISTLSAFSTSGRWVYVVRKHKDSPAQLERFSVPAALAAAPAPAALAATEPAD